MQKIARLAVAALALAAVAGPTLAQTAEDVFGVWRNPENGSNVEMYKCGDSLCAKIVSISDPQKSDDKNPDAGKRSRPIVGLVIMEDAKRSASGTWTGTLYNRADGGSYAGTVKAKSKDALELTGCKAVVLCKTTTWTRVK